MTDNGRIHIGTSGWHYEHWVGPFYPAGTSKARFLPYYSRHFHTVEINNSFYRLPEKQTFELRRESVPPGFIFAVKASRFITHMKRLKDPARPLALFIERAVLLGDKLGPVLFQLPPNFPRNLERLVNFLLALPPGHRYAFEFRETSWFHPEVYAVLSRRNAAFCIFELAGLRSPLEVTADFAYVRLHGPGRAYSGNYDYETLAGWAKTILEWAGKGKEVYFYFDNDEHGYAPKNAGQLQELTSEKG